MKPIRMAAAGILMSSLSVLYADISLAHEAGVGARSFALANNYVAAANDVSAVYWNPAALAFLPVREIQGSVEVLSQTSDVTYFGTHESSDLSRLRIGNAGYLFAMPTSQGGLSFAAAFQSPYIFDQNPSFHHTFSDAAGSVEQRRIYRGFGNMHFWSGALGIQVAPGLGIGIAPSYVSGSETIRDNWRETSSAGVADTTEEKDRTYSGFDVRLGALYSHPKSGIRIGGRLVLPQTIGYVEQSTYSGEWHGTLYSSFSGALGVAATLPFMIVTSEIRFRAPYDIIFPEESIPSGSPAHYFKNGAGIGGEIPLSKSNLLLRFGYSYDEYDPYRFAMRYDGEPVGFKAGGAAWGTDGVTEGHQFQMRRLTLFVASSIYRRIKFLSEIEF
ncbi:MAG: hypothetical protein MUF22_06665, partial [Chitinispirillaceae bacterium]|nr:hypothetical protein [Chitinispirillaceae bacterium]